MIHISLSLAGVKLNATLLNSKAGVKSETLMTFILRWVALSVMPARDRMYPHRQSMKTSMMDSKTVTSKVPTGGQEALFSGKILGKEMGRQSRSHLAPASRNPGPS